MFIGLNYIYYHYLQLNRYTEYRLFKKVTKVTLYPIMFTRYFLASLFLFMPDIFYY